MSDSVVELAHHEEARALFGLRDENLRRLCLVTGARVVLRGNQVRITGEPDQVDQCLEILQRWRDVILQQNTELAPSDIISSLGEDPAGNGKMIHSELQHSSHSENNNYFSGRGISGFAARQRSCRSDSSEDGRTEDLHGCHAKQRTRAV